MKVAFTKFVMNWQGVNKVPVPQNFEIIGPLVQSVKNEYHLVKF